MTELWSDYLRPTLTLDQVLSRSATLHPHRLAVLDGQISRTFSELEAEVATLSEKLRTHGILPGDRVIVSVSTGLSGIVILYALSRVGAVSVPINEFWTAIEVESVVRRSQATCAIADTRLSEKAQPLPTALRAIEPRQEPSLGILDNDLELNWHGIALNRAANLAGAGEVAMLLFTSGSTSAPKGALLTHHGLVGAAHYVALAGEISPDDRSIHMLPHYHVGGVVDGILSVHLVGAASIPVRFNPERILEIFEQERATLLIGFDSMIDAILSAPTYDRRRHPHWTTAMITGSEQTYDRLIAAGVTRIVTGYAMTETSGLAASTRPSQPPVARRNAQWLPAPGVEIQVVDPDTGHRLSEGESGELAIKGWSLFAGYIDGTDGRDENGFLRTGDRVRLGQDGTFTFEGRLKEMVKTGGENVACHEVEDFLVANIPSVRSAVVVGIPDRRWGQAVVALVEFDPGTSLSESEVRKRCSGKLSAFKIPKHVLIVAPGTWPLMATGKVDRKALTDLATKTLHSSLTSAKA